MDWTLVVDAIGKLAWPVVTLVLGFFLKKPVHELAKRLIRVKAGGLEIDAGNVPSAPALPAEKQRLALPDGTGGSPAPTELPATSDSSSSSAGTSAPAPLAAIDAHEVAPAPPDVTALELGRGRPEKLLLSSWHGLHTRMRNRTGVIGEGAIQMLVATKLLTPDEAKTVDRLRTLRNRVVEGASVSAMAATQFHETAESIMTRIDERATKKDIARVMDYLRATTLSQVEIRPIKTKSGHESFDRRSAVFNGRSLPIEWDLAREFIMRGAQDATVGPQN